MATLGILKIVLADEVMNNINDDDEGCGNSNFLINGALLAAT